MKLKRLLGLSLLSAAFASPSFGADVHRPNILLILADDLGLTDVGAYGSEISTPNLDRLAKGGARMSSFYASPFCSPTRAMLMSGTDNHLAGFGDMAELLLPEQKGKPGYEGYLNERVLAIPQVLHDAGYRTVMAGKWHLGTAENQSPAARGFDQSYAMVQGGASHFGDQTGIVALDANKPPKALYRENGKSIDIPRDGFYSSEVFANKVMEYLDKTDGTKKPFFAYLAFTAPHWPLQAPDADIQKYVDRYKGGYDEIRRERVERLKKAGLLSPNTPVFEGNSRWPKWDSLSPAEKRAEAKRMAVYAAMVDNMDRQIGRVLAYLEKKGELDNTVVFFLSDNGADGNSVYDVGETRKWLHRDMDNSIENTGRPGSFVEYGPGWAQVGMTPMRMYKAFTYEGGISVPAIAWGPGVGIKGSERGALTHVSDIAPTIYELAGTHHPGTEYRGKSILPVRGKSLLSYLKGEAPNVHDADEAIGWELGGRKALRKGDWKIVYANQPWGSGHWELYNIAQDRTESHDLAAAMPDKLNELLAAWKQYVAETGTLEIDGLANRPGYSNAGRYYEDLALEAAQKPKAPAATK